QRRGRQLVAIDVAILVLVEPVEVLLDHAPRFLLADLAVLVGVEALQDGIDALLDEGLAAGLQLVGVDLAVVVLVDLAEEVVDALQLLAAALVTVAHLDEDEDDVGGAAAL